MSLKTIIDGVENFLEGAKDEVKAEIDVADTFVNKVLVFAATPEGQNIEDIIEAVIPSEISGALKLWLPDVFIALKWATAELNKSNTQILADGATYLVSTTGVVKAAQANTLKAIVSNYISENNGTGLTIQQALTVAQPTHAHLTAAA